MNERTDENVLFFIVCVFIDGTCSIAIFIGIDLVESLHLFRSNRVSSVQSVVDPFVRFRLDGEMERLVSVPLDRCAVVDDGSLVDLVRLSLPRHLSQSNGRGACAVPLLSLSQLLRHLHRRAHSPAQIISPNTVDPQ